MALPDHFDDEWLESVDLGFLDSVAAQVLDRGSAVAEAGTGANTQPSGSAGPPLPAFPPPMRAPFAAAPQGTDRARPFACAEGREGRPEAPPQHAFPVPPLQPPAGVPSLAARAEAAELRAELARLRGALAFRDEEAAASARAATAAQERLHSASAAAAAAQQQAHELARERDAAAAEAASARASAEAARQQAAALVLAQAPAAAPPGEPPRDGKRHKRDAHGAEAGPAEALAERAHKAASWPPLLRCWPPDSVGVPAGACSSPAAQPFVALLLRDAPEALYALLEAPPPTAAAGGGSSDAPVAASLLAPHGYAAPPTLRGPARHRDAVRRALAACWSAPASVVAGCGEEQEAAAGQLVAPLCGLLCAAGACASRGDGLGSRADRAHAIAAMETLRLCARSHNGARSLLLSALAPAGAQPALPARMFLARAGGQPVHENPWRGCDESRASVNASCAPLGIVPSLAALLHAAAGGRCRRTAEAALRLTVALVSASSALGGRAAFAEFAQAAGPLAPWLRPEAHHACLLPASQCFALLCACPCARHALRNDRLSAAAAAAAAAPAPPRGGASTSLGAAVVVREACPAKPLEGLLLRCLRVLESDAPPPAARRHCVSALFTLSHCAWPDWPAAAFAARAASRLAAAAGSALHREPDAHGGSLAADCLRLLGLLVTERDTGPTVIRELAGDVGCAQRALAAAAAAADCQDATVRRLGKHLADKVATHAAQAERAAAGRKAAGAGGV